MNTENYVDAVAKVAAIQARMSKAMDDYEAADRVVANLSSELSNARKELNNITDGHIAMAYGDGGSVG